MSRLRIAAAQSISQSGDIALNVATHCRFIEEAANAHVDILVFPELSLTGYDLPRLQQNVLSASDEILDPLRYQVRATGVITIVGVPLATKDGQGVHIGALMLFPDGTSLTYGKQYLHNGEEQLHAIPGDMAPFRYLLGEDIVSLAICADITQGKHARSAASIGATLYLAGVLISESGYETDTTYLARNAEHYGYTILMANHGGPSGGYASAGKSAIWSNTGALVAAAPGPGNFLVIGQRREGVWSGEVLPVEVRR
jgi:predicted amidohydrolase